MEKIVADATSVKWWYEKDAKPVGPLGEEEIRAIILAGHLKPDSLVWRTGLQTWVQITQSDLADSILIKADIPPPPIANVTYNPVGSNSPTKTADTYSTAESTPDSDKPAWYNKKSTLWLSLLVWPAWIYGMYKTSLYPRSRKKLFASALIGFFVIGAIMDDGTGSVRVSPWDHSVDVVERYIKKNYLRDPDSYESVHWEPVQKRGDGTYQVMHTFRAKNGFGGKGQETLTFTIAKDGKTIIGYY